MTAIDSDFNYSITMKSNQQNKLIKSVKPPNIQYRSSQESNGDFERDS